jgi:hypothetical protein
MFNMITGFAADFWAILADMSPYLILGFLIAGFLSVLISQQTVEKHIGKRGAASVVKASLFGVPLPLCSCGVIPVGMSLRRHGAGRGAATAFIISTPQTGADSLLVTYSLLGPLFAIIKAVSAFVTGVAGGLLVNAMNDREDKRNGLVKPIKPEACTGACCAPANGSSKTKRALSYGLVALPRDIGAYLFWGLVAAAAISALIPHNYFQAILGRGILPMIVMMVVGIPMYVCSTASVPIAAAFMIAGVSPGAALVFLMTGPATNAATITTVWNVLGRRTAIIYLAVIAGGAMLSGLLLDALSLGAGSYLTQTGVFELPVWFKNISAAALIVLLAPALLSRFNKKQAHNACGCGDTGCEDAHTEACDSEPAHEHSACSSQGCSCGKS